MDTIVNMQPIWKRKLSCPMRYAIEFSVTGSRSFPIDMLRYDRCSPVSTEDAFAILNTFANVRSDELITVRLISYSDRKDWMPTQGRWQSFGWSACMISDGRVM